MGNHSKSETVFKVSIYSSRYRVGIGRVPIMGNHSKSETVFKVTIYSSRYRVGIGRFTIMGNHSWLTRMVPHWFTSYPSNFAYCMQYASNAVGSTQYANKLHRVPETTTFPFTFAYCMQYAQCSTQTNFIEYLKPPPSSNFTYCMQYAPSSTKTNFIEYPKPPIFVNFAYCMQYKQGECL